MTTSELTTATTSTTLTEPLVSVPVNNVADKMQQYVIVDAPGIDIIDKYKTLNFIYSKLKNDLNKLKQIQKKKNEVGSSIYLERAKNKKELDVLNGKRELEILLKFADKDDINSIKKSFYNIWQFNSILKNQDLYKSICELMEERESPVKENLTKEINNYIKSIEEAESKAKKYLDGYKDLEAYISDDVLNINISRPEKEKPIKLSDILKVEKQVNLFCDYKGEMCAYQKEGKRYYEFKDGSYEMTMSWPVKDEDGNYFDCTTVISIGANGITNILKVQIDGEQLYESQEIVDWAEQNKELYIQGMPLSEALRNFLGLSHGETLRSNNVDSRESIKINNSDSLPKKVTEKENSWVEKEKQRSEIKKEKTPTCIPS